jgi:hypothetical protein
MRLIPLWLKLGCTLFVCLLVPIYWRRYGAANFLWFSDIALLVAVPALWLESPLLASMMALAVALPELAWNVDFFVRWSTGVSPLGLSAYMFDRSIPRLLRALSLFHVGLPVLLIWLVYRLGYEPDALIGQTLIGALVLSLSYFFSDPRANVNWVHGFGDKPRTKAAPWFLLMLMVMFPLLIYLPTHLVLAKLFGPAAR